jgi:ketosteroid isomerase-like protein
MNFADKEQIRMLFEENYPDYIRSHDMSAYGEMYTEDALVMAPNVPDRCGISDIVEGFADSIANEDIDASFVAEEIEVIGEFGYVIGIGIATVIPRDGSPAKQIKYRALWLVKKEYGQWKIDRNIWNNKPL